MEQQDGRHELIQKLSSNYHVFLSDTCSNNFCLHGCLCLVTVTVSVSYNLTVTVSVSVTLKLIADHNLKVSVS